MNVTDFLLKKKKISVNAVQHGMRLNYLDNERGMDRSRVFANPNYQDHDVGLGYLLEKEDNKMPKPHHKKKR